MYHYQAKETEGSWRNVAKRKISKIPHGEAQALEGHSVSPRMLSRHRYDHHPLPCGLNLTPSPYQEVTLPLTTGHGKPSRPLTHVLSSEQDLSYESWDMKFKYDKPEWKSIKRVSQNSGTCQYQDCGNYALEETLWRPFYHPCFMGSHSGICPSWHHPSQSQVIDLKSYNSMDTTILIESICQGEKNVWWEWLEFLVDLMTLSL